MMTSLPRRSSLSHTPTKRCRRTPRRPPCAARRGCLKRLSSGCRHSHSGPRRNDDVVPSLLSHSQRTAVTMTWCHLPVTFAADRAVTMAWCHLPITFTADRAVTMAWCHLFCPRRSSSRASRGCAASPTTAARSRREARRRAPRQFVTRRGPEVRGSKSLRSARQFVTRQFLAAVQWRPGPYATTRHHLSACARRGGANTPPSLGVRSARRGVAGGAPRRVRMTSSSLSAPRRRDDDRSPGPTAAATVLSATGRARRRRRRRRPTRHRDASRARARRARCAREETVAQTVAPRRRRRVRGARWRGVTAASRVS